MHGRPATFCCQLPKLAAHVSCVSVVRMQNYNFSSKLDPNNTDWQWPQPINATAGAIGHFTGGAHRLRGDCVCCHTALHWQNTQHEPACVANSCRCCPPLLLSLLPTTCKPQAAALLGSRTG